MSSDRAAVCRQSGSGICRVLVLDPQAAGALLRRRLCCGRRSRIAGRNGCSGSPLHSSKRRNITSTARCLALRVCDLRHCRRSASSTLEALAAHHRQLEIWAEHCPENFENRAALVGAEIARLEGRDLDAMRLYEQAIRSARANGFVHNEALAYELAAALLSRRVASTSSRDLYLRNARHCYLRWGADGKVRQLDRVYPHLGERRASRRLRRARSGRRSNI